MKINFRAFLTIPGIVFITFPGYQILKDTLITYPEFYLSGVIALILELVWPRIRIQNISIIPVCLWRSIPSSREQGAWN
jgi:hypothetical protein